MLKASQILRVDYYQHCVAHGLHLLLTVDSLNDVDEVQELLLKCRKIVSTLHFKSYLVQDELAATADRAEVEKLIARVSAVSELHELDDTFPVADEATDVDPPKENVRRDHQHTTLKLSCPTRWNSSLTMIESIVDLQAEVQNSLKRIGHAELCIHAQELDMLQQLVKFLKEFETFTDLVSTAGPTLSLVSLKIRKMCKISPSDDAWMKEVKRKIIANVGRRLTSNEAAKVQRILDPDTKGLVATDIATALLRVAVDKCCDRGILKLEAHPGIKRTICV